MTYNNILFGISDGIATLTLNRPDKLNSFTAEMHGEVRAALERVAADKSVRVLVLTGAGRGFCAGQDLGDRAVAPGGAPVDLGESVEKYYAPLVLALRALPMPIICAVNGVAAGAGANIALACDIVLAAKSAKFIQAFAKLGLVPDAGGTWSLARFLGEPRAKALALTAEPLPAETAAEWGLIWKAVEDAALMAEAEALAASLAAGPTLGLGLTKRLIQQAATQTLDAQLDAERDAQQQAGRSADYAEGVTAFLEKRPARFSGQ